MISIRGVVKRFGTQTVLNGVDFEVQDGETVASFSGGVLKTDA